jgi:hypothetical protein
LNVVKVILGTLAAVLLAVCAIYGFLWYASFEGELDSASNGPIYVARDAEAFGILQQVPRDNQELDQAVNRTNRRILAVGSGTRVRIKSESYFDGTRFRSGFLLSSGYKRQMRRVLSVQILTGSCQGLVVFVPAERFHNYW